MSDTEILQAFFDKKIDSLLQNLGTHVDTKFSQHDKLLQNSLGVLDNKITKVNDLVEELKEMTKEFHQGQKELEDLVRKNKELRGEGEGEADTVKTSYVG